MQIVEVDIAKEIEKHCAESPTFKKAWEDSREEYKLIGETVTLKKQEHIIQDKSKLFDME